MPGDLTEDEIEKLLTLARAEAEGRLRLAPARPPEGYDPTRAPDAELERFGLPPRPHRLRQPRLLRQWGRLMVPGMRYVRPGVGDLIFNVLQQRVLGMRGNASEGGHGVWAPTRWGTSRNWSGAVIAAQGGELFERVAGSWIVPSPARPGGKGANLPALGSWRSSAWIGLDGYRGWSRSLPQIGTASVVEPDKLTGQLRPRCYAWVQWWVRGKHFGEIEVASFPVAARDEIHAELVVREKRDEVSFHMTRLRAGEAPLHMDIIWAAGKVLAELGKGPDTLGDGEPFDRSLTPAEGRTAVWCVERPLSLPKPSRPSQLYPLPALEPVPFTAALAGARVPGAAGPSERDLTTARRIRMVGRAVGDTVERTRFLTSPATGALRDSLAVKQPAG